MCQHYYPVKITAFVGAALGVQLGVQLGIIKVAIIQYQYQALGIQSNAHTDYIQGGKFLQ
jgi:hypothetical protein